jgi:hypothetical protein
VTHQGYVAITNNNLIYPAIGVSENGNGAIVFTLTGPNYFPSAAYIPISSASGLASAVRLAAAGAAPDDGFTMSPPAFNGFAGRWGDYSAAVAVADDSVWIATEYISKKKRDKLTNWSTLLACCRLPTATSSPNHAEGRWPSWSPPLLIRGFADVGNQCGNECFFQISVGCKTLVTCIFSQVFELFVAGSC